jgi:hypothetical protein
MPDEMKAVMKSQRQKKVNLTWATGLYVSIGNPWGTVGERALTVDLSVDYNALLVYRRYTNEKFEPVEGCNWEVIGTLRHDSSFRWKSSPFEIPRDISYYFQLTVRASQYPPPSAAAASGPLVANVQIGPWTEGERREKEQQHRIRRLVEGAYDES